MNKDLPWDGKPTSSRYSIAHPNEKLPPEFESCAEQLVEKMGFDDIYERWTVCTIYHKLRLVFPTADRNVTQLYCMNCLANDLEISVEDLLTKIEDFKFQGYTLFE